MDVLSDILHAVHLSGAILGRAEFSSPWGVSSEGLTSPMFHIVLSGNGFIALEGGEPIPLGTGDLIMMPHGHTHRLQSDRSVPTVKFTDLMVGNPPRKPDIIRSGGSGAITAIACGHLAFDRGEMHPLLAQLPPLIHIRGGGNGAHDWLETTSQLISSELRAERMGTAALLDRLGGVLFIQVVRAYVESLPPNQAGWLGALRDPRIGGALELIHEAPAQAWSIGELACEVGMSRSAFAGRFKALVGETPMQYLTRWRMHRAAHYLRTEGLGVHDVAGRVGYESSATFSKAFKRYIGAAPAAYRRSRSGSPDIEMCAAFEGKTA
ncbi:MAG: AraC family transcriptional regulator [Rhodospirillales bacterium]|nr:AraC family transcriptional regulator [Rhodospirillales bacterium]